MLYNRLVHLHARQMLKTYTLKEINRIPTRVGKRIISSVKGK